METEKWILRGFENEEVNALAIDPENPSTLYVTTREGVFKSVNSGETWRALNAATETHLNDALVIDPKDSSILYGIGRGVQSGGLYESADAGESWSEVKTDLHPVVLNCMSRSSGLAIDPKEPAKLYLIGPDFWVSEDRGRHWRRLDNSESPVLTLAIDPKEPSTLYLGTTHNDAKKSTDGGKLWQNLAVLEEPLPIYSIAIDPENSAILYAATYYGLYKSTNAGEGLSWREINNGVDISGYGYSSGGGSIVIDGSKPSTIYASVGGVVYLSTNRGETWTVAGTGLQGGAIKQLVVDPKNSSILYARGTRGLWQLGP
ncbi:MAG TPA: hypothetical protein VIS96_07495 [Terrimicrobiaceae bacterium]